WQRDPGLFGQAARGVRRLFVTARHVSHQHNTVIRQFVQSEHVSRSGSTAKTKSLIQYQYGIILNPGLDEYKTGTVWIWRSPESQRNRRNRAGSPESSIRQTLSEAEGEAYQCVSWSCLPIPCDCGDSARFRAISATLRTVNRSAHILTAARH